jgi:hypothetical protein
MPRSVKKTKSVRAPFGFHWIRKGIDRYSLVRNKGSFVPYPGASLTVKFKVEEKK